MGLRPLYLVALAGAMLVAGVAIGQGRGSASLPLKVDTKTFPAAATVDASFTAQTADFDVEAATANMRLVGFTVRESAATAAAATVVLRHGVLSAGNCTATGVFAFVELSANESVGDFFDGRGLAAASGICADVLAGTVDVGVYTVTEATP